jgi:hypothetical protein
MTCENKSTFDRAGDIKIAPSTADLPDFVLDQSGSVPTWNEATRRIQARLSASDYTNRFTGRWASRVQGKILAADEQVRQFVKSTALLTFTGNPMLPGSNDSYIPPTSFLTALTESRGPRRRELRRTLNEKTGSWIALRCMGAHQSGYLHCHLAICADVVFSRSSLDSIVMKHVETSPIAHSEGHQIDDAIQVEPEPTSEPVGAIAYSSLNLPGMVSVLQSAETDSPPRGILEEEEHRVRTAAVLEATGTEAVRIDSGPDVEAEWY